MFAAFLLSTLIVPPRPAARLPAPEPAGAAVVRAAYAMYRNQWFESLFYIKRVELQDARTTTRIETWYEAQQPPGLVRIDFAPAMTGRAIIYRNDSTYEFGRGQLRTAQHGGLIPLYWVLYNLHTIPPEKSIPVLKRFGFDLDRTYSRVWDGEPVFVVGALAGDTVSNQFWIEKKRMLMVRMIERNAADPHKPLDARVTKYQRAGKGWLEGRVQIYLGGELSQVADYNLAGVNKPVEPMLFEPTPFHTPHWVGPMTDLYGGLANSLPQSNGP